MARRQVYSGHKLFGYSLRRVQIAIERLPGVEWLDRYSPLDDESSKANADARRTGTLAEEVRRANAKWEAIAQCPRSLGFEPVSIEHPPNRCAVCYTDKETDVNQLIQVSETSGHASHQPQSPSNVSFSPLLCSPAGLSVRFVPDSSTHGLLWNPGEAQTG